MLISQNNNKNKPVLYSITAEFSCNAHYKYDSRLYFRDVENGTEPEDCYLLIKDSGIPHRKIGDIVTIETEIDKRKLCLDCSMIFFSDMCYKDVSLGPNEPTDYLAVPHSGNYFFFERGIPATFEALFILNGKDENCWYGSPLVLFNDYSSGILL